MKLRLRSAAIGLLLLAVVLFLYNTPVLTVALSMLSGLAVHEILTETKYMPSETGGFLCGIYACVSIFLVEWNMGAYFLTLLVFEGILLFAVLIAHKRFSFLQACACMMLTVAIPLSFSTVLMMRDMEHGGVIYLILVCVASWVTDTGAFFAGKAFGRRKLSPEISPNKTIGGAIGGLLATGIVFPLVCYWQHSSLLEKTEFSLLHAIFIGLICAFFGMLGDLVASAIKRQTGIKDFGNIMPGHGGVMDRFDSFLFVAPALFCLIQVFPIFIYRG